MSPPPRPSDLAVGCTLVTFALAIIGLVVVLWAIWHLVPRVLGW